MTRAERAVLATSQARDLCLSLQRAFVGVRAVEALRRDPSRLDPVELRIALGLAWAERDLALLRAARARLPRERITADPVVSALLDAAG